MTRDQTLKSWINENLEENIDYEPASSDASFRRYFRLNYNNRSYIVMDAPPDKEPLTSYIDITGILLENNLRAPQIYKIDKKNGFLLLEDFGKKPLLTVLKGSNYDEYYNAAIKIVIELQKINKNNNLQEYSKNILKHEMALFNEWYLLRNKEILLSEEDMNGLNKTLEIIAESNISQPFFFVHRDFHSRNLMLLNDNGLGMLDFQDARIGPITYDLVSLLKDAYIELDEEFIIDKVVRYWEMACMEGLLQKSDFSDFFQQFEIMGVQRHLKILGIFSRLSLRDGKHNYLNDIPLVEKYLLNVCERYSLLTPIRKILRRAIHEH